MKNPFRRLGRLVFPSSTWSRPHRRDRYATTIGHEEAYDYEPVDSHTASGNDDEANWLDEELDGLSIIVETGKTGFDERKAARRERQTGRTRSVQSTHARPQSGTLSDVSGFSGFPSHARIEDDEIRLLRLFLANGRSDQLCCTVITARRTQAPAYEALSYEWGSTERPKSIIMNGSRVQIGRNLWDALHAIVSDAKECAPMLWVDALCIDQFNNIEKFQQVAQMGPIYREARRVNCWIGNADSDSDAAITFLKSAARFLDSLDPWRTDLNQQCISLAEWIVGNGNFHLVDAVHDLLIGRSYWGRMWIRQEIILAKDVAIYCGSEKMHWSESIQVCTVFRKMLGIPGMQQRMSAFTRFRGFERSRVDVGYQKDGMWLLKELGSSRPSFSTDPRDKVFGLLGMFQQRPPSDAYRLQPNYGLNFSEVCLEVFRYCVFAESGTPRGEQCLNILCSSRPALSNAAFPSWLADWSAHKTPKPIHTVSTWALPGYARASNDEPAKAKLSPDGRRLKCKGLRIGRVRDVGRSEKRMKRGALASMVKNWAKIARNHDERKPDSQRFTPILFLRTARTPSPLVREQITQLLSGSEGSDSFEICYELLKRLAMLSRSSEVFAISEVGEYLLVPAEARSGDILAVFYGCDGPVLLRERQGSGYTFVGGCYIEGSMYGEAVERQRSGIYRSHTFELV
ncbi:Heterokaryon incompatibility [Macrophomina phaseolina MS6]|uniref:Heterokaryon incompatibility n=1 Tax=Macrophomina phaseolina (strain MS6) TaxID=1126212 RepID=K2S1J1_MACPH|nr:Heterokaryon incompatibility [Macrophomina phaseolina MS6]